ncbi:hypothetical protein DCD75_18550, partial [Acinetobacter baumannii]
SYQRHDGQDDVGAGKGESGNESAGAGSVSVHCAAEEVVDAVPRHKNCQRAEDGRQSHGHVTVSFEPAPMSGVNENQ